MKEGIILDKTMVAEEFQASQVKQHGMIGAGVKMGVAAFVGSAAGSAATLAGQALFAAGEKQEAADGESDVVVNDNEVTPVLEEATAANDVAVVENAVHIETSSAPVAHVTDDMSFGQAFASARQQVGAGGVFAWHGKLYGTYYKDEWDNMTPEEKADYQASVDYDNIPVNHNDVSHEAHLDLAENNQEAEINENNDVHETASETSDMDVHVISVEHNVNMNGYDVDVAVIEIDGHQGLLVDVDGNNEVDGAIVDFNDDGQIQQNEISPDLSGEHIAMPQMSDGDMFMVQNDDMPDYTNDAIV